MKCGLKVPLQPRFLALTFQNLSHSSGLGHLSGKQRVWILLFGQSTQEVSQKNGGTQSMDMLTNPCCFMFGCCPAKTGLFPLQGP